MKPLIQAVTDIINTKFANRSFSAYDVTQALRDDVNNKLYIIPEFRDNSFKFDNVNSQIVSHSTVKKVVESLYANGFITRRLQHNRGFSTSWYVYTLLTKLIDVTKYPKYNELLAVIEDATGIDEANITPHTDFGVNLDDLDRVEFIMNLEYVLKIDITDSAATKFCNSKQLTPYTVVLDIIGYKPTVVSNLTKTPSPTSDTKTSNLNVLLKGYITKAHSKGYNPTLRNAQKAMVKKVPGTTVEIVATVARKIGYKLVGDRSMAFNEYAISIS